VRSPDSGARHLLRSATGGGSTGRRRGGSCSGSLGGTGRALLASPPTVPLAAAGQDRQGPNQAAQWGAGCVSDLTSRSTWAGPGLPDWATLRWASFRPRKAQLGLSSQPQTPATARAHSVALSEQGSVALRKASKNPTKLET
jgi:hypothetical protein